MNSLRYMRFGVLKEKLSKRHNKRNIKYQTIFMATWCQTTDKYWISSHADVFKYPIDEISR